MQLLYTVDTVTLNASGYSEEEGSEVVTITVTRAGDLLDSITVPFRAKNISDAANAAICKMMLSFRMLSVCIITVFI